MRSPSLALLVAALSLTMPFAGCFSSAPDPAPAMAPATTNETDMDIGANATGGLGAAETNITTGSTHAHDYWEGRQKVVVFDEVVANDFYPIIPEQDVNNGVFMKRIRLPDGQLIFEGAGRMEVMVSQPSEGIQGMRMKYRAPNMEDQSEFVSMEFDVPVEVELTPRMTDMPHAYTSLWRWYFYSDGTAEPMSGTFKITITVYKARNVEMWPAHPDFYKDKDYRVIMEEKQGRTDYFGFGELFFSTRDNGGAINPEFLISMGTAFVDVHYNVTGYTAPGEPSGYFLEYMNATQDDFLRNAERISNEGNHYHYRIPVHEYAHDSPYAPGSRWQFRVLATFGNAGLCPGCFPYQVEYTMSMIAYPFEDKADAADAMNETPR